MKPQKLSLLKVLGSQLVVYDQDIAAKKVEPAADD